MTQGIDPERMADVVAKAIKLAIEPLIKRIVALEARPKAFEFFQGPWQPNLTYEPGDTCNYKDSLWICVKQTSARPGDPDPESRSWRMGLRGVRRDGGTHR